MRLRPFSRLQQLDLLGGLVPPFFAWPHEPCPRNLSGHDRICSSRGVPRRLGGLAPGLQSMAGARPLPAGFTDGRAILRGNGAAMRGSGDVVVRIRSVATPEGQAAGGVGARRAAEARGDVSRTVGGPAASR